MAVQLLKACAAQLPPHLTPPSPVEVAEGIEAVLSHEDEIASRAGELLDGRRVILGAAEGVALAREVGLKLSEAAYLDNQALELEQFFHGYVPAYGPGDHILAILGPAAGHRAADLAKVADIVGLSLLQLDLPTFAAWSPAANADTFPWLAGVYLQLLTYHAALLRGTDPDQLRREDPRYLAARQAYR
jgi:glucosamine 6-phosphate synthetase-like amidotransferase/phosphosugar isomerase protein